MAELGGSQISALLETVPGIARVLRSPVADSLVAMIRAGAGIGDFKLADVDELVQYAVRRGLISGDEGERLSAEVKAAGRGGGRSTVKPARAKKPKASKKKPAARQAAKKKPVKRSSPRKAVKRR